MPCFDCPNKRRPQDVSDLADRKAYNDEHHLKGVTGHTLNAELIKGNTARNDSSLPGAGTLPQHAVLRRNPGTCNVSYVQTNAGRRMSHMQALHFGERLTSTKHPH
jgi:hypothetical protein